MALIVIKVVVFFLSLLSTLGLIEDVIERIILFNKDEKYEGQYNLNKINLFPQALVVTAVVFWTIFFYLMKFQ